MNSKLNISIMTAAAAVVVPMSLSAAARPDKPNVVLILADDLGWQDLKCYDIDDPSPYETPNIDKLSSQSVMFWQGYSPAPTSAPSRGAILSGKHPARLQRTHVVGGAPVTPASIPSVVMTPWYAGRLDLDNLTIPEVLSPAGYVTGHSGKWHMAIDHHSYPQPKDHGFDYSKSDRGAATTIKGGRLNDFATTNPKDPYMLDKDGFPRDQTTIDALSFIDKNKNKPFFLYYATWLVHAPIQTRSKVLLEKYCKKMNLPFPTDPGYLKIAGQSNPYYGAMVEMFDNYVGDVVDYLTTTDDPRWKGHKLIENTYIIFTSDNGGYEGSREVYTDNAPLDKGKIHAEEGGTRVPFMVSGPGVAKGVKSNVMVSGLDIMPTIASWSGAKIEKGTILDGADLSILLAKDPQDASLVKSQDGEVRDVIIHHFPHSTAMHSTIRVGEYKLFHNYMTTLAPYRLYQLYDQKTGERVDIEESRDLAEQMPEKVKQMDAMLMERLKGMDASFPYLNPQAPRHAKHRPSMGKVVKSGADGRDIWVSYSDPKYKISAVEVLYSINPATSDEEWFRLKVEKFGNGRAEATLPAEATHYIWGLVDDHNFYYSYPQMGTTRDYVPRNSYYSKDAIKVE